MIRDLGMEQVLSPQDDRMGDPVWMQVDDWDVNVGRVLQEIVRVGRSVQVVSQEGLPGDIPLPDTGVHEGVVVYQYRPGPSDGEEDPILYVDEAGHVRVQVDGRVMSVAEAMGTDR